MKIKQLIEKLSKLDPNIEILLASDSEGNVYNQLNEILFDENTARFLNIDGNIEIFDEQSIEDGEITKKEYEKAKPCIILYP